MTTAVRVKYLLALLTGASIMLVLWAIWTFVREDSSDVIVVGGGAEQHAVGDGVGGFEISGSIDVPLSPGRAERLDLSIVNENAGELSVSDLVVTLTDVTAPAATAELPCRLDDFSVEQSDAAIVVPADDSISLSGAGLDEDELPRVGMLNTDVNQDGCKGASLSLEYSAVGAVL